MQRIGCAKPERALVDEPRRPLEAAPVTGSTVRLSATSRLHMASAAARCVGSIWPERSLIAMAEDSSVIVQSLIRSSAGSYSANQTWTRGVMASLASAATSSEVPR
jgi:hypothetical protein